MRKGYKETMTKRSHDDEGNPIYGSPLSLKEVGGEPIDTEEGKTIKQEATEEEITKFIALFVDLEDTVNFISKHMDSGKYIVAKAHGMQAKKIIADIKALFLNYKVTENSLDDKSNIHN